MADKMGSARLLNSILHILIEHRAMRVLLAGDGSGWKADVLRIANGPKVRADVLRESRELIAYLQQSSFDEQVVALLTTVLEAAGVLQGIKSFQNPR